MDKQQDWTLFHGEEHDFGTVLRFGRNLKTCDENDMIITVNMPEEDPLSTKAAGTVKKKRETIAGLK